MLGAPEYIISNEIAKTATNATIKHNTDQINNIYTVMLYSNALLELDTDT